MNKKIIIGLLISVFAQAADHSAAQALIMPSNGIGLVVQAENLYDIDHILMDPNVFNLYTPHALLMVSNFTQHMTLTQLYKPDGGRCGGLNGKLIQLQHFLTRRFLGETLVIPASILPLFTKQTGEIVIDMCKVIPETLFIEEAMRPGTLIRFYGELIALKAPSHGVYAASRGIQAKVDEWLAWFAEQGVVSL